MTRPTCFTMAIGIIRQVWGGGSARTRLGSREDKTCLGLFYNNPLTYWDYLGNDGQSNLELLRDELGEDLSTDATMCKQFANTATTVLNETPIGQVKIAFTGKGLTDSQVSGAEQAAAVAGFIPWEKALQLAGKGVNCCKRVVVCVKYKYRIRKVDKRLPDWTVSPGRKPGSTRYVDPANPQGNRVRVDKGNPESPFPAQQVDHVVIQCDGRTLMRDGSLLPPNSRIDEFPAETHIPFDEWLKWKNWREK